ncbi:MAG: hypothetical protein AAGA58_20140 [Verrucomicrobiota bacterium]
MKREQRLFWSMIFLSFALANAVAAEDSDPVEKIVATAEELVAGISFDYHAAKTDLESKLEAALNQKEAQLQRDGNLKGLLALKEVREKFAEDKQPETLKAEVTESLGKVFAEELDKLLREREKNTLSIREKEAKALEDLRISLTKAGNLELAQKADAAFKVAQKVVSEMAPRVAAAAETPDENTPDSLAGNSPKRFAKYVGENPMEESKWLSDRTIGSGKIDGERKKVEITNAKGTPRSKIEILPETMIEGGQIFLNDGELKIASSHFSGVSFPVDLHGKFYAADSTFENCTFRKGGGWFVKKWSAKWSFENCVFGKSFFTKWGAHMVGMKAERCTFYHVEFPSFNYRDDAGDEANNDNLFLRQCKFVSCELPQSVLLFCEDCEFIDCRFVDDSGFEISKEVTRTLYVPDFRGEVPARPPYMRFDVKDEPAPVAGANLHHRYYSGKLVMLE